MQRFTSSRFNVPTITFGESVPARSARGGFTLVEMLVAVALVMLMMGLFASIFQLAGGSISTQRGLMENDQRSRTLQTVIKGDLDKRTMRLVQPFAANELSPQAYPDANLALRQGYFEIWENDPNDNTDDGFSFTVDNRINSLSGDTTLYSGKAIRLEQPPTPFPTITNQPEADDASTDVNSTGESPCAEITYFFRKGSAGRPGALYRRVLLLRNPLQGVGISDQTDPTFPVNNIPQLLFDSSPSSLAPANMKYQVSPAPPAGTGATGNFWSDFDYSAYFLPQSAAGMPTGARFNGVVSLSNDVNNTANAIANPRFRFGHNSLTALPREYDSNGAYFGRFTHEETSNTAFTYPQSIAGVGGNPLAQGTTATLQNGVINEYSAGSRRGTDLLLSHVHAFNVRVWDDNLNVKAFVDIGGASTIDYAPNQNLLLDPATNLPIYTNTIFQDPATGTLSYNSSAPNRPIGANRFDTWNSQINIDGVPGNDPPPFRPQFYRQDYDLAPTIATIVPGWAPSAPASLGTVILPYSDSTQAWTPSLTFFNGLRCVSTTNTPAARRLRYRASSLGDLNMDGVITGGTTEPVWPTTGTGFVDDGEIRWHAELNGQNGRPFYYKCVRIPGGGATGLTGAVEPGNWPRDPGRTVPDGGVVWEAVSNLKPLKAISIEILFLDPTSQQMRQLTIVQSLTP